MMESINVIVDDNPEERGIVEDKNDISPQQIDVQDKGSDIEIESANSEETTINKGHSIRIQKDRPIENATRNLDEGVITTSKSMIANSYFISKIKPKNLKEALNGEF